MNSADHSIDIDSALQPISDEREKIGRLLYRFAWAIEIFAVIIGLAIALMQGLSSAQEMTADNPILGLSGWTNILIASVPFVMVAVVELTKIPFVGAFYKTSSLIWKSVFGLSLVFIAFITFESAMNGFERNFHSLIYSAVSSNNCNSVTQRANPLAAP
ncbi:hypothetical protein KOI40_18170 [Aestuariicella sp. G3-2]|uniref:hypothetical protein n=1 Tax=Pseudomaricurvus albidus TaxID=2842452 RepID=UPI001C0BFF83|nr:hypothetical protein [Aestuariicella albida]MBU3071757.1 hypothetical protein [Aestuariicella albida]